MRRIPGATAVKGFRGRSFALESSLYGTAKEKGKGGKRVLAAVAL